ncbi:MAG: FkbM family methyltransferase [Bacteroidia bacterium]|nr:FkbM family methyltransferase [Bacteroidia bacterium]
MSFVKNTYGQMLDLLYKVDKSAYKKWRFRKIDRLNWQNVEQLGHEPEMLVLEELCNIDPQATFFDVGSFIGAYIKIALRKLRPESIYAFEPNPELNRRLVELFPDVSINKYALSDREQIGKIKIPIINNSNFAPRATLNTEYVEEGETDRKFYDVEIISLDKFRIQKNIDRVDIIKIDVEGHEFKAIKGATEILKKDQPVLIIEIEERHHPQAGTKEIFDFIEDHSYKTCYYNSKEHQLKFLRSHEDLMRMQKTEDFKTSAYINNFIFIPDSKDPEDVLSRINRSILEKIKKE